jgi:lambda family phage portal protein
MANPLKERVRQAIVKFLAGDKRAVSQAAIVDRLSSDWRMSSASGNQEVRADIKTLRKRARSLFRDDPYVNGLVRDFVLNINGTKGIELHPKNETSKDKLNDEANNAIRDAWKEWGNSENASTDGVMNWVEIQDQVVEGFVVDGEAILRKHKGFNNDYRFAVELIDPDLIDERMNVERSSQTGNRIIMGVEVDKWYRPVAYHILTVHPSEAGQRVTNRVPADEIVHIFKRKRIGQTRGVTHLQPIIFRLHMLGAYEDAEVTASRISASKMGFFETDPQHADGFESEQEGGAQQKTVTMEVTPGAMEDLPPGKKFVPWDPQHPNTAYKEFTAAVLRSIAVGGGVAYTTLTGDLTGVNYSSIRAGLLTERDMWKKSQDFFSSHLHRRIYNDWLGMALLAGKLQLAGSLLAEKWNKAEWKGRGWKWVDPYNDSRANEMNVAMGFTSRTQIHADQGTDLEDTLKELAREKELAEKYDVFIDGMAAKLDIPQPIPDEEQSGGSGMPDGGSGPTSSVKPKPKAKPARSGAVELYYDKTTQVA